jgi:hypothetical protein
MNEQLDERKKTLDSISMEEFMEIADKIEMFKRKK